MTINLTQEAGYKKVILTPGGLVLYLFNFARTSIHIVRKNLFVIPCLK